jgi:hypothetical protein
MNCRYHIQGRYFLVALFSLNIMALPFALSISKSTPHDNLVLVAALAFMMTLNAAGMAPGDRRRRIAREGDC